MNTDSAQLDLISGQLDLGVVYEAVPETDQSRNRDETSDPWPGVTQPAGWFLRAARVTTPPLGPVSVSSSSTDREPGEPRIETGPGVQAPVPSPADPNGVPFIPRPRRSPETSVWQHSYYLWAESGIPWQQRPPQPSSMRGSVPIAQTSPLERVDRAHDPAVPDADPDRARAGYAARHARVKPAKPGKPPKQDKQPPAPRRDALELPAFAAAQFLGAPVQLSSRAGTPPASTAPMSAASAASAAGASGARARAASMGTGTLLLDRPPAAPSWPAAPTAAPATGPGGTGGTGSAGPPPDPSAFRPRLMFGRRALALGVPVLVLAMVAATAVALLTGHGPNANRAFAADSAESAQLAGQTAMPGYPVAPGRGVFESANRIVVYGTTAVVTAQAGTAQAGTARADQATTRQRFFVSGDAGATWRLAQVQAEPGGPADPALGHDAPLLAGGAKGWIAVGPQAIWTSQSGQIWTLRAGHGIGQLPGDQVHVVTATSAGFLAGGTSAGGQAVVWTSADGVIWHRSTPDLGATTISYATAYAGLTLVTGVRPDGASAAWLSTDGGTTWTEVTIPVTHGATGTIAGVAADPAGLLAVRDGAAGDAITYFSQNGRTWHFAGTLGASGGLRPRVVKGNGYGLVVAGQDSTGQLVAYRGADTPHQATWRPTAILGHAAVEDVVGAAVAPGDSVIAIGATAATPVAQQPVLVRATASSVTPASLPPEVPELAVSAAAQAGHTQVAVGSANGYPAIWRRTLVDGSWTAWTLVSGTALFGQDTLGQITSITHGPSSWLAVGRVGSGSITLTSPDGATWHVA